MCNSAVNLALAMSAMAKDTTTTAQERKDVDVLLIGAGVMSATLGAWLQDLEPDWSIEMVERLDSVAEESSNGWNNAGTGHAALAELNYTPQQADGSIDISKAVTINGCSRFPASSGLIRSRKATCATLKALFTARRT